jgi:hypothetical protein
MVEENEKENPKTSNDFDGVRGFPKKRDIWVSSVSGGLGGVVLGSMAFLIPVVNTWLSNSREIQILQIKNTSEQIAYITKRMEDSDKERDLYKREMLECQQQLRDVKNGK